MNLSHPIYDKINQRLSSDFPGLNLSVDWQYLISPLPVSVSPSTWENLKLGVQALYHTSRLSKFQISRPHQELLQTPNDSVLMSYDFHSSKDGQLALIEINTNASGYLISCLGLAAERNVSFYDLPEIHLLKRSFEEELLSTGKKTNAIQVAIVDEDVDQQKMRIEFLMYQALFEKWGWGAEICESKELTWDAKTKQLLSPGGKSIQLVYNRLTDFLLDDPKHTPIKTAWLDGAITLSPQPKEYLLLADKSLLMIFQNSHLLLDLDASTKWAEDISRVLIPISEITSFPDKEELWKNRKSLFFKPRNSYGGKAVYRGESVSRKVFERLLTENGLVQKFFPAQKLSEDDADPLSIWKFDLRAYAYRDQVQHLTARVYQGQVTNFSSRMGGFSSVEIKN